ncbi:hypothetical protein PO909_021148 [Leuciscus waleckii]
MNTINIFIWTIALFIQECRGQITVTQSPSIPAVQPGEEVRINCKTSSRVSSVHMVITYTGTHRNLEKLLNSSYIGQQPVILELHLDSVAVDLAVILL